MSLVFNPFTGQPDFTGTGGSGTPGGSTNAAQVNDGAGGFAGTNLLLVDGSAITTDAVTPETLATITLSANTNYHILIEYVGRVTAAGGIPVVGDLSAGTARVDANRIGAGAVVLDTQDNLAGLSFSQNTPPTVDATPSGNDVLITIVGGDAATTVSWKAVIRVVSV